MVVTALPLTSLIGVTAGSDGFAVEMDGAGAARGHPAAKFRSGEPEDVSEIPEHRHRRVAVECLRLAIDVQSEHASLPVESDWFSSPWLPGDTSA